MKLGLISDTHGLHELIEIEKCDILFHSGDISNIGDIKEIKQFIEWFSSRSAKYKVFIGGNHDRGLDVKYYKDRTYPIEVELGKKNYNRVNKIIRNLPKNVIYLENSGAKILGLNIWGSPYSPSHYRWNWAFNADRGEEILKVWERIPENTDILLTHTPPKGVFDLAPVVFRDRKISDEMTEKGCEDLLTKIKNLKNLKIHSFGHIHQETPCNLKYRVKRRNGALLINSSVLNNDYALVTKSPIYIEI